MHAASHLAKDLTRAFCTTVKACSCHSTQLVNLYASLELQVMYVLTCLSSLKETVWACADKYDTMLASSVSQPEVDIVAVYPVL